MTVIWAGQGVDVSRCWAPEGHAVAAVCCCRARCGIEPVISSV